MSIVADSALSISPPSHLGASTVGTIHGRSKFSSAIFLGKVLRVLCVLLLVRLYLSLILLEQRRASLSRLIVCFRFQAFISGDVVMYMDVCIFSMSFSLRCLCLRSFVWFGSLSARNRILQTSFQYQWWSCLALPYYLESSDSLERASTTLSWLSAFVLLKTARRSNFF